MSTIVTFYSFKGGVGRSMALANIAVLLAKRGLKVLVVDWDLEAPGLERYFSYFEQSTKSGGLLPFFTEVAKKLGTKKSLPRYQDHTWDIHVDATHSFTLIPSGRDIHTHYATMLEQFDWHRFFKKGGGDFIERLRDQWRTDFDVVLVDSRTGMSDTGGICTIQIPDVLVAMFTANDQSMLGVIDIIQAAQRGRQHLAYDRMALTVLPVLCRFSSSTEFQESLKWLDRFAEHFLGVCDDWLPPWVPLRHVFEQLKIPQVDWFGFGERLAVIEQGNSDPSGIGSVLERITDLLASNFGDLEAALGNVVRRPADWKRPERMKSLEKTTEDEKDYAYDVFVSFRPGGVLNEWVETFITDLTNWLEIELAEPPRVFFDVKNIAAGDSWTTQTELALKRSKLLLAILTPAYFASPSCTREWALFATRERLTKNVPLIYPLLVRGGSALPKSVWDRQLLDVSKTVTLISNRRQQASPEYYELLKNAAADIAKMLEKVPPYDSELEIVVDEAILENLRPPAKNLGLPKL